MPASENNTIDVQEIENFAKDSAHWWDESGPFRPLHRLNPARMSYIRQQIEDHFSLSDPASLAPFKGLKVLDIGCGGGLVCEPMARLGADVNGIDADRNAIDVAIAHAAQSGLDIAYRNGSAESLLPKESGRYDVVLALEIIEHVADRDAFIESCAALCKPGGLIIFSTLNRTAKSYAMSIIAAEYILRWVPRGTHSWDKFVRPSELAASLRHAGLSAVNEKGLVINPLSGEFQISDKDVDVNYFMSARKPD
ncbi:MAG: bifunctional 2-polyprenyl-6-hydroxyphenol methylase/3-demethylubiquinol 3-O-methyltransferase UbiG [Rhodospirillales bacterium]|nr:bifunctional 2-polyprenyl-6-hydroxyphenol methylase/3-demethylubiquinol 3-O-methyltransferase UbiG [Rhodospirillales bacterium]